MEVGIDIPIGKGPHEQKQSVLPPIAGVRTDGGFTIVQQSDWHAEATIRPWPIRLGDEIHVHFFVANRPDVQVERLEAAIECEEAYLLSNDEHLGWKTKSHSTTLLPVPSLKDGRPLRFEWTSRIPAIGPASMQTHDVKLSWILFVRIVMPHWNVFESKFNLLVLPEVRE